MPPTGPAAIPAPIRLAIVDALGRANPTTHVADLLDLLHADAEARRARSRAWELGDPIARAVSAVDDALQQPDPLALLHDAAVEIHGALGTNPAAATETAEALTLLWTTAVGVFGGAARASAILLLREAVRPGAACPVILDDHRGTTPARLVASVAALMRAHAAAGDDRLRLRAELLAAPFDVPEFHCLEGADPTVRGADALARLLARLDRAILRRDTTFATRELPLIRMGVESIEDDGERAAILLRVQSASPDADLPEILGDLVSQRARPALPHLSLDVALTTHIARDARREAARKYLLRADEAADDALAVACLLRALHLQRASGADLADVLATALRASAFAAAATGTTGARALLGDIEFAARCLTGDPPVAPPSAPVEHRLVSALHACVHAWKNGDTPIVTDAALSPLLALLSARRGIQLAPAPRVGEWSCPASGILLARAGHRSGGLGRDHAWSAADLWVAWICAHAAGRLADDVTIWSLIAARTDGELADHARVAVALAGVATGAARESITAEVDRIPDAAWRDALRERIADALPALATPTAPAPPNDAPPAPTTPNPAPPHDAPRTPREVVDAIVRAQTGDEARILDASDLDDTALGELESTLVFRADDSGDEVCARLLWAAARIAIRQNRPRDASRHAREAIARNPRHVEALLWLADDAERGERWDEAAGLLESAARLIGNEEHRADLYRRLGDLYADRLSRRGVALENYLVSFICRSGDAHTFGRLRELYESSGRFRDLLGAYDIAIQFAEDHPDRAELDLDELLSERARLQFQHLGDPEGALVTLLRVLRRTPTDRHTLDIVLRLLAGRVPAEGVREAVRLHLASLSGAEAEAAHADPALAAWRS